jgi:putative NIF3 family GTP cyclohydrolase 1 type 2
LDIVKEELVAVHKSSLSRREFVALTSGLPLIGLPSAVAAGSAALTADQVVAAIRQAVEASGVTWSSQTVDTFKAGNPSTVVTGIVTTALATFEVLHRAVLTRANLIVTIEPTFHIRSDSPDSSTVAAAKLQFIEDNGLVVWRFSDHWPQVTPNPLAKGLVEAMGWNWGNVHGDPPRLVIPTVGGGRGAGRIRLAALSAQIKNRLKVTGMRVVGLPSTPVTTVGLLPGTTGLSDTRALTPDVDVILAGEVRDWMGAEYMNDLANAGHGKGMILVGRVVSEEPGMKVCADWLNTLGLGVTANAISGGDPYWRPL